MALWSQPASADGHEQWFGEELTIPPPVPGERLFVERLSVSGDWAALTLRAATDLQVNVRAYGGDDGQTLVFRAASSLTTGEAGLLGPAPEWGVPIGHGLLAGRAWRGGRPQP